MSFSLLLALAAIAGGTAATYFYERDAMLSSRLAAGTATGLAALGLVGFILASFLGLNSTTLLLSGLVVASPLAWLFGADRLGRVRDDFDELRREARAAVVGERPWARARLLCYAGVVLLFWLLFGRVMFERDGEIFTGVEQNLGDLPFHTSIITGFAFGDNFPPQHTEFSGVRLTYPFIVDFVAAMFLRAGASLRGALFWENFLLALALVQLLYRWAWKLTRERAVARLVPALVLLSGGLGWWLFLREWNAGSLGFFEMLTSMRHDYTLTTDGLYRWGNALTVLLIPQRGLLLGLPLALIVWTLWWQTIGDDVSERGRGGERGGAPIAEARRNTKKGKQGKRQQHAPTPQPASPVSPEATFFDASVRRMTAAGVVAGLLPLVHAHSFVVMMGMGGCVALLFPKWWRAWAAFFVVALVLAAPQMFWATRESGARASTFFGWEFGWDRGQQNVVWFWLRNTGLFIPLLVAALLWRGKDDEEPVVPRRLLLFLSPFALCFLVPNVYKLQPWIWDNIKILFYWWVAAAPVVALLLVRLWRQTGVWWRAGVVVACFVLMASGALDIWRVVSKGAEQRIFDRDAVALGELIKRETPPRSLLLRAPTYNHGVYLSGRRSLMGYAGHLWTHGLDYLPREQDLRRIYAGGAEAETLLKKYGIEYVVLGAPERAAGAVNQQFFERYTKVVQAGGYRLYRTTQP